MESCGGQHNNLKLLYITRWKFDNEIVAICPACGELFDKDDFPELAQQNNVNVNNK